MTRDQLMTLSKIGYRVAEALAIWYFIVEFPFPVLEFVYELY